VPEHRPPDAVHRLDVRTVVVLGHAGSGKTTLVHALCGTAPGEAPPTTALTLHSARHEGTVVRLLDTPGHPDLVGAVRAGLHAADVALFVVSAVDGLDAASALLWQECESLDLRRVVVVTKIDLPRADFEETFAVCRRVLGAELVATHLPLHADDEAVAGLLDLLREQVVDYSPDAPPPLPHRRPADHEHLALIEGARADLVEAVLAHADDDTLLDRYLADEPVDPLELVAQLGLALDAGALHLVLPVASGVVGNRELLEALAGLPAREAPPLWTPDGSPRPPLTADPHGPLVAQVIATSRVGEHRRSLVRVLSGTLNPGQPLSAAQAGRALTLTWPGAACAAGDVCAVEGLDAATMDTLTGSDEPGLLAGWPLPEPTTVVALVCATSAGPDDATLAAAVRRVALDDPTVLANGDGTVLRVIGERHLAVVVERLAGLGVQVRTRLLDRPLFETFTRPAGGHAEIDGVRAEVEVLPGEVGSGLVVRAPAGLELLLREAAAAGVLAGYPLTDVRLELVAPAAATAALGPAVRAALGDAATRGAPALLEPVEDVSVEVDDAYLDVVTRDLSIRRGRVVATTAVGSGRTRVRADVPASSLSGYAVDLRALAHGTAELTRTPAGWAPLPAQLVERILADRYEPDA